MFAEQLPATPKLTFVVLSHADAAILNARLRGLVPLCSAYCVELLVVRSSAACAGDPSEAFPGMRVIEVDAERTDGPALRRLGFAEATGDIVVFGEDSDGSACERLSRLIQTYGLVAETQASDRLRTASGATTSPSDALIPQFVSQSTSAGVPRRESFIGGELLR